MKFLLSFIFCLSLVLGIRGQDYDLEILFFHPPEEAKPNSFKRAQEIIDLGNSVILVDIGVDIRYAFSIKEGSFKGSNSTFQFYLNFWKTKTKEEKSYILKDIKGNMNRIHITFAKKYNNQSIYQNNFSIEFPPKIPSHSKQRTNTDIGFERNDRIVTLINSLKDECYHLKANLSATPPDTFLLIYQQILHTYNKGENNLIYQIKMKDEGYYMSLPEFEKLETFVEELRTYRNSLETQTQPPTTTTSSSSSSSSSSTTVSDTHSKDKSIKTDEKVNSQDGPLEENIGKKATSKYDTKQLKKENTKLKDDIKNKDITIRNLRLELSTQKNKERELELENLNLRNEVQPLQEDKERYQKLYKKYFDLVVNPTLDRFIGWSLLINFEINHNFDFGEANFEWIRLNKQPFTYGITDEKYKELLGKYRAVEFDNEITKSQKQKVPSDYFIGKYEVTNKQYKAFVKDHIIPKGGENKPVVGLTYDEMIKFCQKVNQKYPGLHVDLPTELEWEFAARGPEAKDYPWGNEFPTGYTAVPVANIGGAQLQEVGRYAGGKSWCGAYDMIGNAYEMCRIDKYNYQFETTSEIGTARGGSFKTSAPQSRTTARYTLFGKRPREDVGFRLVIRPRTY